MNYPIRISGLAGFSIIWLGQIISVLATSMSSFALSLWVIQESGSVTVYGLTRVFHLTPILLLSPLAGVLIDRYNRKWMMMLSDLLAVLATALILLLSILGELQVWHILAAAAFQGIGNAFQGPAYSAAIGMMIPKEHYGRASGMMSLMKSGPAVLAPLLAGALYPLVGLSGLLALDVTTFFVAILTLRFIPIPHLPRTAPASADLSTLWQESLYGLKYIFTRSGLLGMELVFFFGNLFGGMALTVIAPMILRRTDGDSLALGTVLSASALAGVAGALVMSVWGGPKRRIHGVLLGTFISCCFGLALVGIGQGLLIWIIGSMIFASLSPLVNGCETAILQAKVAPDVQGRVFAAVNFISWFTNPLSPLVAGLFADQLLEPWMDSQNGWAQALGSVFGNHPGAGMGLLITLCGLGAALAGLAGYLSPSLRNLEYDLPDHDQNGTLKKITVTT